MDRSPVVSQILKKKAELMGRASAIKDELRRIEADLAILDKAVLLFAPSTDLDSILAKRKRTKIFKRGELLRHILTVLRKAGEPLTAMQIAKAVKARTKLKQDILPNVKRALREQSNAGRLKEVGEAFGRQKLWTIEARNNQATSARAGVVELRPRP